MKQLDCPQSVSTRHTSADDRQLQRRAAVAKLRAQGMTLRQVQSALPAEGIVNPIGRTYALSTIERDLEVLRREWREQALQDTSIDLARVLNGLQAIYRRALDADDCATSLKALKLEIELRGLEPPPFVANRYALFSDAERAEHTGTDAVLEVGWSDTR